MRFIDKHSDPWHAVIGDDGPVVNVTPAPNSLLTFAQWHAVRSTWPAGMPVGVQFANDADIEELEADLSRLALVVLHFPKWTDGRAYSQAHLLRARFRFAGEVRATGEVLVDMMPLLARTGFDAVELRHDQSIEAAERALNFFGGHYQGDVREHRPLFARPAGEAWRHGDEFVQQGAAI